MLSVQATDEVGQAFNLQRASARLSSASFIGSGLR